MFLNKTLFKKWIKNAYNNGGLSVGMVYGGLVLSGKGWITWTEDEAVPNWVKAAVIEHAGELPAHGHIFKAQKDELTQYEMPENGFLNLPGRFLEAKHAFDVCPVIYTTKYMEYRLLQSRTTNKVLLLPEYYHKVIDLSELGKENPPMGPSSNSEMEGSMMMWRNENSALTVRSMEKGYDRHGICGMLEGINFGKEET